MERNPQFQKVKKAQEALRYQFISTELDLALTFADIARPTNDEARSERNLDHAFAFTTNPSQSAARAMRSNPRNVWVV